MQIVFRCNIQADDRDVLSAVLKAISEEVKDNRLDECEGETFHYDYTWSIDEEDEKNE